MRQCVCVCVCVCVRLCVPVFAPRWPLNKKESCKNLKDLQLRHGLSGVMSHTGTLNIAGSLRCTSLCLGFYLTLCMFVQVCTCMLASVPKSVTVSICVHEQVCFSICVNVHVCLLIGIPSRLSSFTLMGFLAGLLPLAISLWLRQRQYCSDLFWSARHRGA